jgi:hypothetical protein
VDEWAEEGRGEVFGVLNVGGEVRTWGEREGEAVRVWMEGIWRGKEREQREIRWGDDCEREVVGEVEKGDDVSLSWEGDEEDVWR